MYVRLSLKIRAILFPRALFPGLGDIKQRDLLEGLVKKSLFPRSSDGGARREVREPEKIKVEYYEREGESPGGSTPL